jgi:hypothetical protein
MFGSMGSTGPFWDALSWWLSPSHVLGVVMLGLFLVLHVVIVRLAVSRVNGPDRPTVRPGRRSHDVAHGPGSA